jgi:hypothetical protein
VAVPSQTDKSAALIAPKIGRDLRACKAFPEATNGVVVVDVRVRLPRQGNSDAVITEVRGSHVVSASVRFGKQGTFVYFRGATRVRTAALVRPGAWYHSIVTVHLATKTYDWRLLNAVGRPVLNVRGIAWADPGAGAPLDGVCLRSPIGGPGIALDWDDISVVR